MPLQVGKICVGPGLAELADRHPVIGEVRGLGVFWALDLVVGPGDPGDAGSVRRLVGRLWAS